MSEQYESKILDHLGLVAGMYDELGIGKVIDQAIAQDEEKRIVSLGRVVKAMVLNGLGFVGHQLYLVPLFYESKPTERLIGEGIKAEHLNDDVLGRALDDLYEFGVTPLYSLIATRACKELNLNPNKGHLDTTSFHVDGTYNSKDGPEEGEIHITKGYSRDHRPDLNQVILELIVENQAGIPMLMKPLSGNSNDKTAFGEIIKEHIEQLQQGYGLEYIVSDSALYTEQNLREMSGIKWISRVPETIKEAKQAIEDTGIDTMEPINEHYRYKILNSDYAGVPQRWMLIYSEHAAKRAIHTLNGTLSKKSEHELKEFEKLCRIEFACEPDAIKTLEKFRKNLKCTLIFSHHIEQIARYTNAGRPKKDNLPYKYIYRINGAMASCLDNRQAQLHKKSCFIVATNELDTEKLPNLDLFEGYKDQSLVEKGFRFIKDPKFLVSTLYLKSPKRIEALLMVMTICLMVYAALEYRIRKELKEKNQFCTDQVGKPTQTPTTRWIFQCFAGIHLLSVAGIKDIVLNLKEDHWLILNLLGGRYGAFYS